MILIPIVGIRDGNHNFELECQASSIEGIGQEYRGVVRTEGTIKKIGSRYHLDADVFSDATLLCDRSLEEFTEPIHVTLSLEFVVDPDLAQQQRNHVGDLGDDEVRGLREDEREINITEDIRQLLRLSIPLRAVAPQFRDKDLEDIYPSMRAKDGANDGEAIDDRWSALAQLKRNNH